ncbi:MAG: hypothetical protein V7700_05270 [Halioglobus sp.]
MSRASLPAPLLITLLLACWVSSTFLWAQEVEPAADQQPASAQERAFRNAISSVESSQGAYAAQLSEQLLSLGLSLQSQGRHEEAIDLFKRGAHLSRINDGLYSAQQVPMLQGQIASHIASGDYALADERQHYMYRVQVRSTDSGPEHTAALMQQANWQHSAYRLGIGAQGYTRIMNMWDLYRLALNDIIKREGETSPSLLPPLRGMLKAQYLIAGYDWDNVGSISSDDLDARQSLNRFNAYRAQSYQKGSAVITAIRDIEQKNHLEQDSAAANALIMLGDWQLWHNDRAEAWQSYQSAIAELAERDDAQVMIEHLFGEPVALPDIAGIRPLPPAVDTEQGNILLEFGVTGRGRVVNLERLDESEGNTGHANQFMRKLRKTKFRPRFEAGQPTETEKIVSAFNIE